MPKRDPKTGRFVSSEQSSLDALDTLLRAGNLTSDDLVDYMDEYELVVKALEFYERNK